MYIYYIIHIVTARKQASVSVLKNLLLAWLEIRDRHNAESDSGCAPWNGSCLQTMYYSQNLLMSRLTLNLEVFLELGYLFAFYKFCVMTKNTCFCARYAICMNCALLSSFYEPVAKTFALNEFRLLYCLYFTRLVFSFVSRYKVVV